MNYDFVIIGGSVAGAMIGKLLSKHEYNTLIIDRAKFPRYKCCSGLVSKDRSEKYIKKHFGEIPKEILCKNSPMNVGFSKTGKFFVETKEGSMLLTHREKLDYWLLSNCNTEYIDSHNFIDYEILKDGKLKLKLKNKNGYEYIITKYLIGADGSRSKIRQQIDPNFNPHDNNTFAYQKYYKGTSTFKDKTLYYLTGKKYSDAFAWFNKKDDNLCIGTSYLIENRGKKEEYWQNLIFYLKENFDLKLENGIRHEGGFMDVRKNPDKFFLGKDNIFLVGEATGLMTMFGEGLPSAFETCECLIQSILNKKNILSDYKLLLKNEIEYIKNTWL